MEGDTDSQIPPVAQYRPEDDRLPMFVPPRIGRDDEDEKKRCGLNYFRVTIAAGQTVRLPMLGDYFQYVTNDGTPSGVDISLDDQDSFSVFIPGAPVYVRRRVLAWVRAATACSLLVLIGDGVRVHHNDAYAAGPIESATQDPWLNAAAITTLTLVSAANNPRGILLCPGATIRLPRTGLETDFGQLQILLGATVRVLGAGMPSSPWVLPHGVLVPPNADLQLRYIGDVAYDIGFTKL